MESNSSNSLRTQLILLAAAQGAMFWYAIEKIFYLEQGVTLGQVVILGMVSQGSKIIFEVPTSVFADRWSRRGTLLAANAIFALASIIIGLSSSFYLFVAALVVWSLSDALRSGVYEAFTYDSLKSQGLQKQYRKVYTKMLSAELTLITIAGLAAGFVGRFASLRLNFFITIIPIAAASFILWHMKEPQIARTQHSGENWLRHIDGATKIMKSVELRWVVLLTSVILGFTFIGYEYYQLIGVDVGLPEVWYGVLIGALTMGMALGAEIAHKKPGTKQWLLVGWIGLAATMLLGWRLGNAVFVVVNLFALFIALRLLRVYLDVYLHERIPSERRATILSLAGMLSYVWFFMFAAAFSVLLPRYGVRTAYTLVSLPLLVLAVIDIFKGIKWSTGKTADFVPVEGDHVID